MHIDDTNEKEFQSRRSSYSRQNFYNQNQCDDKLQKQYDDKPLDIDKSDPNIYNQENVQIIKFSSEEQDDNYSSSSEEEITFKDIPKLGFKFIVSKLFWIIYDCVKYIYFFIYYRIYSVLFTIGFMLLILTENIETAKSLMSTAIDMKNKQVEQSLTINSNQKKIDNAKKFIEDTNSINNFYKLLISLSKNKPSDCHIESINISFDDDKAQLVIHSNNMQSLSEYLNILGKAKDILMIKGSTVQIVKPEYIQQMKEQVDLKQGAKIKPEGNKEKFSKAKFNKMMEKMGNIPQTINIVNNKFDDKVYASTIQFNF